jgi:hypothetical protein
MIPILTKMERKELLKRYELTVSDVRLLERKGLVKSREIMNQVRQLFPHHEIRSTIFADDYIYYHAKKMKGENQ